jgi:hypothetical protein
MYGYIKSQPNGAIRFCVNILNHEEQGIPLKHDWVSTVYGFISEELIYDSMHGPKCKDICTTTYHDVSLIHNLITGRRMSGIITLINQTPIQWFSKKQSTVETASYGSEYMVASQTTEQIMDL